MSERNINASRRSFFLKGTTALGAGLASTGAGAATLFDASLPLKQQVQHLQRQLAGMEDREALRQLHLAFTAMLEQQRYEAIADLFTDHAVVSLHGERVEGRKAIDALFAQSYANERLPLMSVAHRSHNDQRQDIVSVVEDGDSATACFHRQVEVCTPLPTDSVAADMARQQGMKASSRWENGRYDVRFARVDGQWRISSLHYNVA